MGKKRVAEVDNEELLKETESTGQKGKGKKKKKARHIERGNIYVRASYNNIQITVTNDKGDVLVSSSAGAAGFKGPRKATPFAASRVVEIIMEKMEKINAEEVHIYVSGIGAGRDSAVRALTSKGLNVTAINDITPVPHNGCRPPKPRRV